MSESKNKGKQWQWFPYVFVYDSTSHTKENPASDSPIIYNQPKNIPASIRISVCNQIAGVTQFCAANFSAPSIIKTKWAYIALKYYETYYLVVCGPTAEWAKSRLRSIAMLLEASIGDFHYLRNDCRQNEVLFKTRLSAHLDTIMSKTIPEISFEDLELTSSPLSSTVSSLISPISELQDDIETDSLMGLQERSLTDFPEIDPAQFSAATIQSEISEGSRPIDFYDRELSAIPSLSLPKSGGGVFLKAQELVEACQYQPGVYAGMTLFKNKTLSSQLTGTVWEVLTSLDNNHKEGNILKPTSVDFHLPEGVSLHTMYVKNQALRDIVRKVPKHLCRKLKKKTLHESVQSMEMSSMRNALHNNSLQSYPSHIPPLISASGISPPAREPSPPKGPLDPLLLCSKINKNIDLLCDGRPSRSLPGSPRKIRVSTMLPDVGNNSPQLRYKVLASKMPKPVSSTHNTPKRLPPHMKNRHGALDSENISKGYRVSSLNAPALKRKDYLIKNDAQTKCSETESSVSKSSDQKTKTFNNELDIKNTKNKLNLQFAPNVINRPGDDSETKISMELNGSIKESNNNLIFNKFCNGSSDDEDHSKSEDSDISVLELNSLIQTKDTVDRLFKQATKPMTPPHQEPQTPQNFDRVNVPNIFTDTESPYVRLMIFQHKVADTAITLLMDHDMGNESSSIYDLCQLTSRGLPSLNASIQKALEISEELAGDPFIRKSYSVLSGLDVSSFHPRLVVNMHRSFNNHPNIMEMTLKNKNIVAWGNRLCSTQTYYQMDGIDRPGLPIPSDSLARVSHKARKALERDHTITLL